MTVPPIVDPPAPPAPAPAPPAAAPPAPPAPAPTEGEKKFSAAEVVARMVARKGGGYNAVQAVAEQLVAENQKARVKAARYKERMVEDGDVVLKGAELQEYNRLKALGLSAEQVQQKLAEHMVLQGKVKATEQQQFFREVAEAMGIPNHRAFAKLAEKFGIEIVVKDVTETDADGKKQTTKKPFARLATDTKAELRPLDVYLDEELGEFRSALYDNAPADEAGNGGFGSPSHAPEPRRGVLMTPQSSSVLRKPQATTTTDAVQGVMDARYRHTKAPVKK